MKYNFLPSSDASEYQLVKLEFITRKLPAVTYTIYILESTL